MSRGKGENETERKRKEENGRFCRLVKNSFLIFECRNAIPRSFRVRRSFSPAVSGFLLKKQRHYSSREGNEETEWMGISDEEDAVEITHKGENTAS